MTLLQSILLGVIQGITEFLPVSSSGHLAIAQNLFHIEAQTTILFDILLHLGTLLVVFFVFWKDICRLLGAVFGMLFDLVSRIRSPKQADGGSGGKEEKESAPIIRNNYRKFALLLIVSTIPTALIGFLGKALVTDVSQTLIVPGICLIATGVLLFLSDRAINRGKIPRDITFREATVIGIAQGFATLPGLSRSGTTIATELFCGFDRVFAMRYSFLLSIPAILGAALLELKDADFGSLTPSDAGIYAAGMLTAAVVGYFCMRALLLVIRKRKFRYFAIYCFAVGILAIAGHFLTA